MDPRLYPAPLEPVEGLTMPDPFLLQLLIIAAAGAQLAYAVSLNR